MTDPIKKTLRAGAFATRLAAVGLTGTSAAVDVGHIAYNGWKGSETVTEAAAAAEAAHMTGDLSGLWHLIAHLL